jgi:hypothetical protein
MGGGRRTDGDVEDQAASAIRALVQPDLTEGRLLRTAVVVTLTESADGSAPRTDVYYPLGAPDRATERALLSRAADRLRD